MTIKEAVDAFKALVKQGEKLSDYYCGITNNLEVRAQQHNVTFLNHVEAESVDVANEFEKALQDAGFDCGGLAGNAHEEDSRYVYIYKKGPNTKQ